MKVALLLALASLKGGNSLLTSEIQGYDTNGDGQADTFVQVPYF